MVSNTIEYTRDSEGKLRAVVIPIDLWVKIFPDAASSVEDVAEGLEDYCLGKAMDEAAETPLLGIEEAVAFLEQGSD
ncbi:hypothetical protein [cf. Phormidesmis sp. LEGE 11477]|uniref:hypothetical protein n=1 Tax=cf. Phormidesmis sp. LEGE 11477 TaxID=1828680 RepID=UPI0018821D56|nr:hypothetical protein [cf. Phormidesmis sp. LEGE 11477]MBE9061725.1 hypothetical protein [cf. Phormidesmis sp. LEGE 11477]